MTEAGGGGGDAVAWLVAFGFALGGAAGTRWLLKELLPQMERARFVTVNFAGRLLPRAGGVVPALVAGGAAFLWLWLPEGPGRPSPVEATSFALALLGFAFVGFVDDVLGDRSASGFGGHLRRLARGQMTTGALKALFGGAVALAAAAPLASSFTLTLVYAFVIAVSANGVNLLDVRPGRALKLFFVALALLGAAAVSRPGAKLLFPAAAAFAAFAPDDLRGRTMLGDAGANAAGAAVGFAAVLSGRAAPIAIVAAAFALLHVVAETGSVTLFIEKTPWLRRFDEWGRDKG